MTFTLHKHINLKLSQSFPYLFIYHSLSLLISYQFSLQIAFVFLSFIVVFISILFSSLVHFYHFSPSLRAFFWHSMALLSWHWRCLVFGSFLSLFFIFLSAFLSIFFFVFFFSFLFCIFVYFLLFSF